MCQRPRWYASQASNEFGWFENRAIAFDHLDLAGDRRDDPVADLVEDEESVVELVVERFRPDDSGGSRLGKLDRCSDAASQSPHPTARDIVHVQHPAGFLRTGAPLAKGKDCAARNDKEAAELGEPGDDIVGKSVSEAASRAVANRPVEKRHHRDRSPALCNRAIPDSVGRQRKSARGRCCSPSARDNCRSTPGGEPCFAKRRPVQTLSFEQPGRRSEVLLALANSAAPGKCA